jgi:cysteine desulfurase/selenocysteine lyase
MDFDVHLIRQQFPILSEATVHGKPLVYFDNAATTQKPSSVIEAISHYYRTENSNVHRGVHDLSQRATLNFENTRNELARYLGNIDPKTIIFTKGTTESINLVAHSYPIVFLKPGDAILITEIEHHANIVPWQMACERHGLELLVLPITEKGEWDLDQLPALLEKNVKFIACSWVSNALGTINPIQTMVDAARKIGAKILVDGAQAVGHFKIDFKSLDADFFVFSAHKMFGPTGLGFLIGKEELLDQMPPYQTGGEMIQEVTFEKTTFNGLPFKFETGTPAIAEVIAFQKSLQFLNIISLEKAHQHESMLLKRATDGLHGIPEIVFFGTSDQKVSVLSFNLNGVHPFDVGTILDQRGIAIRTGHHCTQPIMQKFKVPGMCRASFSIYNTIEEVDYFIESVKKAAKMLCS